ncbi:hypothetical protein BDZ45DRAFT_38270 [Acephala macrosclerotiorum]|nr:hypothetical protein BDZ45DRAFT_38270 [Acephala macrosclerotiorum]
MRLVLCLLRAHVDIDFLVWKEDGRSSTNTGGDLGANHFDLAIPGGGVGYFPQGCASQFDGVWMGNQYGGYTNRS